MKKIHHILFPLLLCTGLNAQSKSEIKLSPLFLIDNSAPTLLYEHTFGKHMAWELGLVMNAQTAVFREVEHWGVDSFYYGKSYKYARVGGYGALRWYFSEAGRFRGVFLGAVGSYNEPSFLSPTLKQYFSQIKESDYKYHYIENQLFAGPVLGYKQVLWEHLVVEGLVFFSPYLTRQAKILREQSYLDGNFRIQGGLLIGYRF